MASRPLSSNARVLPALLLAAFLAACAATEPPKETAQASQPQPVKPPEPLVCPPVVQPTCPTPPPPPQPELRGKLVAGAWNELPDWGIDTLRPSLDAFARSCAVLPERDAAWKPACDAALAVPSNATEPEVALYFETTFDVWRVVNPDDTTGGMITGYYEPLLHGSHKKTARYKYPIYSAPPDLLTIDLTSVYPDLNHKRLRGRLEGNRVVPYYSRGDIDGDPKLLEGREIAWVDDAVDVFFLHIQGSGQVEMPDGERLRVGYADQNGHPFRSLGGALIRRGEITPEKASMQGIKEWALHHPKKVREFLDANPSYVFFRVLPGDLPGPLGALGVPLTPERSIAIDPRVIPLGVPVYLATTWPNTDTPLERLVVAQDTGGAIAGAVRADFFWGFGDAAGAQAGKMRQDGHMWVLLPKGMTPPAPN